MSRFEEWLNAIVLTDGLPGLVSIPLNAKISFDPSYIMIVQNVYCKAGCGTFEIRGVFEIILF
jgi:hypothetical protein